MAEFTNDPEAFVCPVCSKRWGNIGLNSELVIQRCEAHKNELSTAEIYARGLSVGNWSRMNRE